MTRLLLLYSEYKYNKFISFFSVFVFILLYVLFSVNQNIPFYYDAQVYWDSSQLFYKNNHFSFLNYDNPLRGYFFPFILFIIRKTADFISIDGILFFRIIHALMFSFITTIIIPNLSELIFKRKQSILNIFFFSLLIIYFWCGYFLYPLTDFFTIGLLCLILYLVLKIDGDRWNFIRIFLIGSGIASVTLVRPSYQIIILPVIIYVVCRFLVVYKEKTKFFINTMIFIVGLCVIFSVQLSINLNLYQIKSIFVPTKEHDGTDLFLKQLNWGIQIQKYETNIGSNYPQASVIFYDKHGKNILEKEKIENIKTYKEYLYLVFKYPFDFILIYFRHIINGFDIIYNTVYIENIYRNRLIFSLLNYSVLFFSFHAIYLLRDKLFKNKDFIISSLFILLPVLLAVPSAVEVRFFLPAFILLYVLISFSGYVDMFLNDLKKNIIIYLFLYILFILIMFGFSNNTMSQIDQGVLLLK